MENQNSINTKSQPVSSKASITTSINYLREVLDMLEWSIDRDRNNIDLWLQDLQPRTNDLLKHFQ